MRPYRAANSHVLAFNELSEGYFSIKGDLTFATINKDTLKAIDCSQNGQSITIDLKNVSATDSAGLALLIEWLKISKHHHCALQFRNIPQQLNALAKISGFDLNLQPNPTDARSV